MRQFGTAVLATVILFILTTSQAHAALIPKLEWIRIYDSPYVVKDDDCGKGITIDAAGNIYVTGYEVRDDLGQKSNIWLRKYDTDGNTLWTRTYDSPNHKDDRGNGVAVDAAGNVYVIGSEERSDLDQMSNIRLRKYDTDGNPLWTRTYDGSAHGDDGGNGVAVDAAGDIYVIGYENSKALGMDHNIWLRKYDTDGNTLWTRTYDSPAHEYDRGCGVAVDAAGNVYVTGCEYRKDLEQESNIWVRKYDANGNVLWMDTYNGSAYQNDRGYGVTVDAVGNAYVTGYANEGTITPYSPDIWVRKYDTDGNIVWTDTYDSPARGFAEGSGVAVDAAGNVYVTGYENRKDLGQGVNLFLRKYDPDGNSLWTLSYNGEAVGTAHFKGYGIALDNAGNIYVTGRGHHPASGLHSDNIVLKFIQVPKPPEPSSPIIPIFRPPGMFVQQAVAAFLLLVAVLLGIVRVLRKRLR